GRGVGDKRSLLPGAPPGLAPAGHELEPGAATSGAGGVGQKMGTVSVVGYAPGLVVGQGPGRNLQAVQMQPRTAGPGPAAGDARNEAGPAEAKEGRRMTAQRRSSR